MKPYQLDDFSENNVWLIFRIDTQVKNKPVDVYMLMDLPSGMILNHEIVEAEFSKKHADNLLKQGKVSKHKMPKRIILTKGDPAETILRDLAKNLAINFESIPAPYLEVLIAPIKQSFGNKFFFTIFPWLYRY